MEKSPDAFRTISEVAEDLDVPQHVLRFWETRFSHIRPMKRGGGRRYYRPEDVDLLRAIRHLLYGEGYTIKGVQRILKEQGPKAVAALVRQGASPARVTPPPAPVEPVFSPPPPQAAPAPVQAPIHASAPAPVYAPPAAPRRPAQPVELDEQVAMEFLTPLPPPPVPPPRPAPRARLGRDEIAKLQSALQELAECQKMLENARFA